MAHSCQSCKRSFGTERQLQQHLDSPAHDFNCGECDRAFGSRQALDQHLESPAHVPVDGFQDRNQTSSKTKAARGQICFQYAESGTCRFGSRCKYSHDTAVIDGTSKSTAWSKKKSKAGQQIGSRPMDHIDRVFAAYPNFDYNPSRPIWTEFNRMCDEFEWDSEDFEMREARRNFKSAMVQQFNDLYGTDEKNLDSWQKLCRLLNLKPIPEDLKECRERVRQTHVNLVDLVDTPRTGSPVHVFASLKQLRTYTIQTEQYFPKEDAKAGGVLRYLLREILHSRVRGNLRPLDTHVPEASFSG